MIRQRRGKPKRWLTFMLCTGATGRGLCAFRVRSNGARFLFSSTKEVTDFLHPNIAVSLHLPLIPIRPFRILVGNGATLLCTHVAKNTQLEMQSSIFPVDLHILPIHGPDVILGMDWLESQGKVAADFAGKTLEFKHGGSMITLKGLFPAPRRISLQTLLSGSPAPDTLKIFEVLLLQPEQPAAVNVAREEFPAGLPWAVSKVLDKFHGVFSLPERMPPKRPFDHRVHLLPGTKPINVRPYRYLTFKKMRLSGKYKKCWSRVSSNGVVAHFHPRCS